MNDSQKKRPSATYRLVHHRRREFLRPAHKPRPTTAATAISTGTILPSRDPVADLTYRLQRLSLCEHSATQIKRAAQPLLLQVSMNRDFDFSFPIESPSNSDTKPSSLVETKAALLSQMQLVLLQANATQPTPPIEFINVQARDDAAFPKVATPCDSQRQEVSDSVQKHPRMQAPRYSTATKELIKSHQARPNTSNKFKPSFAPLMTSSIQPVANTVFDNVSRDYKPCLPSMRPEVPIVNSVQNRIYYVPSDSYQLQSSSHQPFRFLDLPTELRIQIYENFVEGAARLSRKPHVFDYEKLLQHRYLTQTRISLRQICRKVSQEWDPIFFRTNTFIVKAPDPRWRPYPEWTPEALVAARRAPWDPAGVHRPKLLDFISFLRLTSCSDKFRDAHSLEYREGSRRAHHGIVVQSLDLLELQHLQKILSENSGIFAGLREIIISQDVLKIKPKSRSWEATWDILEGPEKRWKSYQEQLKPNAELGLLKGWNVTRQIEHHKDESIPQSLHLISRMQLVFRKSTKCPPPADNTIELPGKDI